MSAKKSAKPSQKNTLLNYFSLTPKQQEKPTVHDIVSPKTNEQTPDTPKRKNYKTNHQDSDEDEEPIVIRRTKRFKKIFDHVDDEEYKPDEEESEDSVEFSDLSLEISDQSDKTDDSGHNKKVCSFKSPKTSGRKKQNGLQKNKPTMNVEKAIAAEQATKTQWPHLSYDFLKPEEIKDLNGNKMLLNGELNPRYDPSTLYVPSSFLDKQTPALRQWWELKSKNFDTILFFKMGKFYEFFHMDAVLCTRELKILFMRGENAHAGFPEKSYKQYADALIQKGYKVARVEQTETPEMMNDRCKKMKKSTKFDKVVKREICRISSIGTRYMSDIDSDTFLDCNSYLMAINCKPLSNFSMEFGICFVDISIGKFFLSQFQDDRFHSKLRILVSHYFPVEIIIEKSNKSSKLIQAICPSSRYECVNKFWTTNQALKYIYQNDLWKKAPESFKNSILDPDDVIQQTSKPEYELAVSSLGAIIECLEKSLIAQDIMTMGQFEIYHPPEFNSDKTELPGNMILDSMTMKNLEIFDPLNFENRSKTSTLFSIVDNCSTAFGKRILKCWMCQPLCGLKEELESRRKAVRELSENEKIVGLVEKWSRIMKKMPDLDRLLTQIHTQSLKRSKDHPDSRAILFESDTYRMRRIKTFLNTLGGFEKIIEIINDINSKFNLIESELLHQLMGFIDEKGTFPRIEDKIKYFRQSFDSEKVRRDGNFIPDKGVDEEYDQTIEKIDEMKKKFEKYLKNQEAFFRVRLNYVHANKNRYTLEIPDSCDSKVSQSDEEFQIKSSRKGFKRYHSPTLIQMIEELEQAENQRNIILGDIFRRFLSKFDQDYNEWRQAINCMAQFDALISLANTRNVFESNGSVSCLPEFLWDQEEPMIRAKDFRNAFLLVNNAVIPNDIELKGETLILTGPNMGGKTTLMRSVGLLTILAQIGAYVPASECQLTPVDRIFTRIGAYDLILENQSSFMVELSETFTILKYATRSSLALIDELGSGTSTFDGTAIASTIILDLTNRIQFRIMFSTHYHSILDEFKNNPRIKFGFMSYMIENENDMDPTEENIIFLYKLQSGTCNKSYGFNVAKLAGIPLPIVRQAHFYSKQFELKCQMKSLLSWFRVRKSQGIDKPNLDSREYDEETKEKARQLRSIMAQLKI